MVKYLAELLYDLFTDPVSPSSGAVSCVYRMNRSSDTQDFTYTEP